jgi:hypothetical protein
MGGLYQASSSREVDVEKGSRYMFWNCFIIMNFTNIMGFQNLNSGLWGMHQWFRHQIQGLWTRFWFNSNLRHTSTFFDSLRQPPATQKPRTYILQFAVQCTRRSLRKTRALHVSFEFWVTGYQINFTSINSPHTSSLCGIMYPDCFYLTASRSSGFIFTFCQFVFRCKRNFLNFF